MFSLGGDKSHLNTDLQRPAYSPTKEGWTPGGILECVVNRVYQGVEVGFGLRLEGFKDESRGGRITRQHLDPVYPSDLYLGSVRNEVELGGCQE